MGVQSDVGTRASIDEATRFAAARHGDQTYGNGLYTDHLAAAAAVAERFGVRDPEVLAAVWLHDVIEDTVPPGDEEAEGRAALRTEIAGRFGPRTAALVWAVTDRPGRNRKARAALTYPAIAAEPGATQVKLFDRIANVEQGIATRSPMLRMYVDEQPAFREALYREGENEALWKHLDELVANARPV
jgi:(p)ppGpp synthase/HD superfamily hydrolase